MNSVLVQKRKSIANEAKANVDHGGGKVDTASVHTVGNDPIFANTILPLPSTMHGTLKCLVQMDYTFTLHIFGLHCFHFFFFEVQLLLWLANRRYYRLCALMLV